MRVLELEWQSHDNLRLYVRIWEPDEPPQAAIGLIHGIGEHVNRYKHWASAFVNEGYAVIGFDQRGYGNSDGKRGYILSYETLLQDIELLMKKATERCLDIPLILFGQSLGGNLVINYSMRMPIKPTCVIASSPWLRLAYDIPVIQEKLGRFLVKILPGMVQKSNFNINDLSRDKEVIKRYVEDALVHNKVSLNLGFSSIDAGLWALENTDKLDIPILLMHGDSDKITSHIATMEFSEKTKALSTLKIWEGFYHELHNEPEKHKIFDYVLNWIRIYSRKVEHI
jgi:alpha-beta hydrolase superfamily lysophospholipase